MKKFALPLLVSLLLLVTTACSLPVVLGAVARAAPGRITRQAIQLFSTPQPSADTVQLADQAGMTDQARSIFFAAQPEIDYDRAIFDQNCQVQASRNTTELGCYTTDGRIFILGISDASASSEMAVAAAHEMLHAAYAQLSTAQQQAVDGLIEQQIKHVHDPNLAARMHMYKQMEPGQRDNELHSILGTEYYPLSSGLEQYYSQYFTSRSQLTAYSHNFDAVFTSLMTNMAVTQYRINSMQRQMQRDLNRQRTNAYDQLVPQFNALVQQYNQDVTIYNSIASDIANQIQPASMQ